MILAASCSEREFDVLLYFFALVKLTNTFGFESDFYSIFHPALAISQFSLDGPRGDHPAGPHTGGWFGWNTALDMDLILVASFETDRPVAHSVL
jgi:hypothetical protein